MSFYYSPKIVTSGLILYTDAANPKSYPRSGNIWYDLSGQGNHGTLGAGVTWSDVNGGVLVCVPNQTITFSGPNMSTVDYTVMGASRYTTPSGRMFSGGTANNWLMGGWTGTTENYYAGNWVSSPSTGTSDTRWRVLTATGRGSSYALYVNGGRTVGPSSAGVTGPAGFILNSWNGSSEFSSAHYSFLMVYNRILTALEIEQNFNALRGRFGI
jgi:hypothetical protein